jgi:outer membrane protein OmpA-like peptidoglycan-associated protein
MSTINPDGTFSKAVNIGAPINNSENSSAVSITPDAQSLLLLNVYLPDGKMEKGISIARRNGNVWGFPEKVNIQNYYNDNIYGEYCLSVSGKYLVMTVQRKDGYGSKDIHISMLQPDGSFSEPKNIGSVINTPDSEASPFLAADEKTLYFSTAGHPGFGKNDVFMTKRLDDTWMNWSVPENLGPDLNSPNWDAYYTFTTNGEYVYYVVSAPGRGGDIFRKKLPASAKPAPVVLVSGKVYDQKTKLPLKSKIQYSDLTTSTTAGSAFSDATTGDYRIILQSGKQFGFLAEADNYYSVSENIDLSKLTTYQEIRRDLYLVPIEKGAAIRLNNLFFDFNKSDLKKESNSELKRLVELLQKYPKMKIEIAGHTDNVGTDETNIPLSNRRAQAVLNWLVLNKIEASRLLAKGYGKSKPIASGNSEEARRQNRRVEFLILEME